MNMQGRVRAREAALDYFLSHLELPDHRRLQVREEEEEEWRGTKKLVWRHRSAILLYMGELANEPGKLDKLDE